MRSTTTPPPAEPTPLGPDSLTWKYFGDLRTGMLGVWIGSLQNMYPQLGAAVEDHSILLSEPLQRVARSVYPIIGVVYDGDRARQAALRQTLRWSRHPRSPHLPGSAAECRCTMSPDTRASSRAPGL